MIEERTFAFALCQAGAEKWLEQEVARRHPDLRPAFRRPGLLTWKSTNGSLPVDFGLDDAVFARASGISLGMASSVDEVVRQARRLGAPMRLHVAERDRFRPQDEPPDFDPRARADEIDRELREGADVFLPASTAQEGDLVLDVIVGEPTEPWLVGFHRHRRGRSPYPGGRLPVIVPSAAPSRAYAKLVEALDFAGFEIRANDVAVEVGSAPGGASYALLERGARVVGIDPGAMDDAVLAFADAGGPKFRHIAAPVGAVRREDLPAHVDWFVMDVHLAPGVALRAAQRLVAWWRSSLRGVVFTLKLHDRAWAERIPGWMERVAEMGLANVRGRQLPSNRQEICVVAEGRAGRKARTDVPMGKGAA